MKLVIHKRSNTVLYEVLRASEFIEMGCQKQGGGRSEEFMFNGYRVPVWEDKKVLELDGVDHCTTM
jgi:hypothetical protein